MKPILPLLLLPLLFAACGEITENKITLDPGTITVGADSTSASFTLTSTAAWLLRDDAPWLTPGVTEGESGAHRVSLALEPNTGSVARTAVVTVTTAGAEKSLALTQLALGDTVTPDPGYKGKLVRKVAIISTDGENPDSVIITFEYGGDGRLIGMSFTGDYGEDDTWTETYTYRYEGTSVIIESDDSERYTATLDPSGRVTDLTWEYIGSDPETYSIRLAYDSEGRILSENGIDYDGEKSEVLYTWAGGDIVRTVERYGGDTADFSYSEYGNKGNLDLNWIFSGSYYGSALGPVGIIGAAGRRCAHYVMPDAYWGNAAHPDHYDGIERPVCEDLIGATRTFEHYRYFYDHSAREADFRFDADGDLTSISLAVPVWRITLDRTYVVELENPDSYEVREDGKKYYWDVHLRETGERETGREQIRTDRIEVTVEY